jgi:glycerol-3-phosphate acyltransferase PlsY
MISITTIALFLTAAYLAGGIPFGLLFTRWRKGIDIRDHGSGNIGATNVRRMAGNTLGTLTLAGDILKGFLPVWAVHWIIPAGHPGFEAALAAVAVAAFCGHLFPVVLGFSGGKGVATAAGAYLAISPLAILGVLLAFGMGLMASRRVSVGSLTAAVVLPIGVAMTTCSVALTIGALVITLGILARHQANIERILAGREPKLF